MPIPFLTRDEWEQVHPLLVTDFERIKSHRLKDGETLSSAIAALRHGACERYAQITGFAETNPNALWHHHLDIYGPECPACGHLFRTPKASFCANCGWRAGHIHIDWMEISSLDDFYRRVFRQMEAPAWHGANLDALYDSWVTGGICPTGPPFEFRFTSQIADARLPAGVAGVILETAGRSVAENGGTIKIAEAP